MASAAGLLGLGVAMAAGAVRMPLTASTAKPPKAATLLPPAAFSVAQFGSAVPTAPPVRVGALATATMRPTAMPKPARTGPATTAPSGQQPSSALVPQPTAQNETPTGQNELAWSEAILTALGAPLTNANVISMGYWMQNEAGTPPSGIVGANNPINVSQPGYGGTPIQYEGGGYSLMSYPTVQDGIQATVAYLTTGSYDAIVSDLKNGAGLTDPSLGDEISEYSGNGYSTIPDSWGASQGTPQTP